MTQIVTAYRTYLLVGLGVLVALGALWWSFSQGTPSNSLLTPEGTSDVAPGDRGLVDTLLQLRAVSLSGTIFSDPGFISLRDFGTQIVPEPVGRPNPFAPLTTRSTTSAATSTKPFAPRRP